MIFGKGWADLARQDTKEYEALIPQGDYLKESKILAYYCPNRIHRIQNNYPGPHQRCYPLVAMLGSWWIHCASKSVSSALDVFAAIPGGFNSTTLGWRLLFLHFFSNQEQSKNTWPKGVNNYCMIQIYLIQVMAVTGRSQIWFASSLQVGLLMTLPL